MFVEYCTLISDIDWKKYCTISTFITEGQSKFTRKPEKGAVRELSERELDRRLEDLEAKHDDEKEAHRMFVLFFFFWFG